MLVFFRILFPSLFVLCLLQGAESARNAGASWDVDGLFYAVIALFMAMGTGMVWAAYLGEKIAEPLTNMLTSGDVIEGENEMARLIHALLKRGWRRTAAWLCFLEAVRHPHAPGVAWLGLGCSKPGGWLEREFAWMVFRFNNAMHCLEAYRVLRRHGIRPPTHGDPMVAMFINAQNAMPKESHPPVPVELHEEPPPLKRNPQIQLFELAADFSSDDKNPPSPDLLNRSAMPAPPGGFMGTYAPAEYVAQRPGCRRTWASRVMSLFGRG